MPRVHADEELMPNRAEACPTPPSLSEACRRRGPPLRERPQPPPAGAWLARLLFARPTVVPPHAAVASEGGIRPLRESRETHSTGHRERFGGLSKFLE